MQSALRAHYHMTLFINRYRQSNPRLYIGTAYLQTGIRLYPYANRKSPFTYGDQMHMGTNICTGYKKLIIRIYAYYMHWI